MEAAYRWREVTHECRATHKNQSPENPERFTHDDDWVPLSVIGSHAVRAANPEFDPRTYGCAKPVDLVEKTGQFQVKRNEIPVRARMKRLQ